MSPSSPERCFHGVILGEPCRSCDEDATITKARAEGVAQGQQEAFAEVQIQYNKLCPYQFDDWLITKTGKIR